MYNCIIALIPIIPPTCWAKGHQQTYPLTVVHWNCHMSSLDPAHLAIAQRREVVPPYAQQVPQRPKDREHVGCNSATQDVPGWILHIS